MQSFDTQTLLDGNDIHVFKQAYQRDGIVKVRGLMDEQFIQAPMHDLLSLLCKVNQMEIKGELSPDSPDKLFEHLQAMNTKTPELALRLGRDLPGFQHLITHQRLRSLMALLLDEESLIMPYDWCLFRIDGPSTKVSHFNWHQDYPYNVISKQAITFWIPMTDVTEDMGGLRYVPGSQHEILPVEIPESFEMNNPNRLPIKQTTQLEDMVSQAEVTEPISLGEAFLFNGLVLHASGENRSDRYRWIANGRYAPATDPELVQRDFYMARTKYPDYFKKAHPEYVF